MDCIGFYTIHIFLDSLVEGYLASFLKLIISVLILILLLPSLKSLSLVAPTRHAALNLACLLEVGQQAWCRDCPQRDKIKCKHCGQLGCKQETYWKLEANKSKRPEWWIDTAAVSVDDGKIIL